MPVTLSGKSFVQIILTKRGAGNFLTRKERTMKYKEHEQVADEVIELLAKKRNVSIEDADRILEIAKQFIRWSPVRPRFNEDSPPQTR
jgi:DNA-binding transcriptional regulator YhcF (GntR family)